MRLNILGNHQRLVIGDWFHALLAEGLEGGWVVAEIELSADKDDWDVWCMVLNLWEPLNSC